MSRKKKNERRTVLVDGKLQARIVLSTSLPMIACLVFATGVEFIYRQQVAAGHLSTGGRVLGMPDHRLGMLLLFVSASMTQLVTALLVSQKVAGTAYRIRQVLNDFRRGDGTERVRLRKGDYQVQLADDLNEFLDWVVANGRTAKGHESTIGGTHSSSGGSGSPATSNPATGSRPRHAGAESEVSS